MNVYDFDKTIYDGDCTVDFIFYCLKKQPSLYKEIPVHLLNGLLFVVRLKKKQQFKERLFSFLKAIDSIDLVIEDFVVSHLKNIKPWYLSQQQPDDLIISASPEFLIGAFCQKLNITHWMASPVNKNTGAYQGRNCYGTEKVRRFDEFYRREDVHSFYSDSYSDDPLAKLSKQAFLVKGHTLHPWNKSKK